jgi:hypothetical protein
VKSWRDSILSEFVPGISKLTIVADLDDLLIEEQLSVELAGRGFDTINYGDPIEFRYAYEYQYRQSQDKDANSRTEVILRLSNHSLDLLPYDLLMAGRSLSFDLGAIFPNLSYPVIRELNRDMLDALYDAQAKSPPDRLGDNATRDFVLRHVYKIASELISSSVDLLRVLVTLHYKAISLPQSLSDRLVELLSAEKVLADWPLSQIVPSADAFFAFLQERWPIFVSGMGSADRVSDNSLESALKFRGPEILPFDHQDIKVYIDNLFLEGRLIPIANINAKSVDQSWIKTGIIRPDSRDNEERVALLFDRIHGEVPNKDSKYTDWQIFATRWAELSALVHNNPIEGNVQRLLELGDSNNCVFMAWLNDHYASLNNLPATSPAMVHHIPRHLARHIADSSDAKVALIVVDGLSLDQWVTVRQVLKSQIRDLHIRETGVFAWIPTVTAVSRQAIFSGRAPAFFPDSIKSTNNESKLWQSFWEGQGISRLDVFYKRSMGYGDPVDILNDSVNLNQTRVIGLVVDTVDGIMHGMQLGARGMHNQVRQWSREEYLKSLVEHLLAFGYNVWLTADHGNIECTGHGKPSEGVMATTQGQRVRIYPTPELRSHGAELCPTAQNWAPIGLPTDYYPLVATGHSAFVNVDETLVSHGGASIEEVIVPFVKIEKRKR